MTTASRTYIVGHLNGGACEAKFFDELPCVHTGIRDLYQGQTGDQLVSILHHKETAGTGPQSRPSQYRII